MTPAKMTEVLDVYYKLLESIGAVPMRDTRPEFLVDLELAKHHLAWMCGETKQLILANRIEKAMRWLGFIQGALWALRLRTLERMKTDNMPPDAAFDAERV